MIVCSRLIHPISFIWRYRLGGLLIRVCASFYSLSANMRLIDGNGPYIIAHTCTGLRYIAALGLLCAPRLLGELRCSLRYLYLDTGRGLADWRAAFCLRHFWLWLGWAHCLSTHQSPHYPSSRLFNAANPERAKPGISYSIRWT